VSDGGRVRRISRGDKYFNVCFPKGGGPSVRGEMHTKQKNSLGEARRKKNAGK